MYAAILPSGEMSNSWYTHDSDHTALRGERDRMRGEAHEQLPQNTAEPAANALSFMFAPDDMVEYAYRFDGNSVAIPRHTPN
jgi:3-deoxy-D-arabino-heptulosonate 7-phosphate (DAHP) synthase class II